MRVLEIGSGSPTQANVALSKMLSRITGRTISDEAREPTLDVVMRAVDRRWNWLGHIHRQEEHRVIRQVLRNFVRPNFDSLFSDVPDLGIRKASEISKEKEKRKCLWP